MKAIIFDMDGVVLDSEKHWDKEVFGLFKKLTGNWTREKHERIVGLNTHDLFGALKKSGIKMSEKVFSKEVDTIAMRIYRTKAEVMPGFIDLAKSLLKKGIAIGLASSSKISWITYALKKSKLTHYFFSISSSQEVKEGKPDPDIYLLAAQKMGFPASDCVAVEDSANGVRAAKAAGCFTIGFRYGGNDDQDHLLADLDLRGFTPKNNQKILELLS